MAMASLCGFFAAIGVSAQNPPGGDVCADIDGASALYEKFTANYNKKPLTIADREVASKAGKEFLEKFGNCEVWKDQAAFVKGWVPKLDEWIKNQKLREQLNALYQQFDNGIKSKKWDDVYTAGEAIYNLIPDKALDQLIPMALIGVVETSKNNLKYNDQSIRWAKLALEKLKAGEPSVNGQFGVFEYAFGKRENAISELTYGLGYIHFVGKRDKKTGVSYFYEATKLPGSKQQYPPMYALIGEFYIDQADPIGREIAKLIETLKTASTDEAKAKLNDEIKAKIALFNGYTERAMDAYSRAYTLAKDTTVAEKNYKKQLYDRLTDLYKRRFDKVDGLDTWVTTAATKPLPDPLSPVQPVSDEEPTTTTVAKPGALNGNTKASTTGAEANGMAKPAAVSAAKKTSN